MKGSNLKYKKMAIQSASREKLLLMFYEAAIKNVKKALFALEQKKIKEKCESIGKACDIVLELNNTLNHDVEKSLSKNLEQLYMFIMDSLIRANANNDKKALEDVLRILNHLYTAWIEAISKLKKEKEIDRSKHEELKKYAE